MTTRRTLTALATLAASAMVMTGCAGSAGASDTGAEGNDKVQKLVVGTSGQTPPWTRLGDDNELSGYDIEVLRAIDKKLDNIEFTYETTEIPAIFAGLDSGRYQIGANNFAQTEERAEKYAFTNPHIEVHYGLALPEGSEPVTSIDELAGKKTFGTPGLNFTKMLEQWNEENPDKAIEINYTELDVQSQYNQLLSGQVDFIFTEQVVHEANGTRDGFNFVWAPLDGEYLVDTFGTSLYTSFVVSKQTPNLDTVLDELNGAVEELRADGTLAELSKEFVGIDITPKNLPESTTAEQ